MRETEDLLLLLKFGDEKQCGDKGGRQQAAAAATGSMASSGLLRT